MPDPRLEHDKDVGWMNIKKLFKEHVGKDMTVQTFQDGI